MTQEATGQQRHARHARRALGWPARSRTRQARSAREQALYDAALPAARAWAGAAALALFLLGFAFDDARWVRLPGFALGLAGAFAALGLGSAYVARRLARRYARSATRAPHPPRPSARCCGTRWSRGSRRWWRWPPSSSGSS